MRLREAVQLVGILAGVGVVAHSLVTWGAWIALVIVVGITIGGLWMWAESRRRQPESSGLLLGFLILAVAGFVVIAKSPANPSRECSEREFTGTDAGSTR